MTISTRTMNMILFILAGVILAMALVFLVRNQVKRPMPLEYVSEELLEQLRTDLIYTSPLPNPDEGFVPEHFVLMYEGLIEQDFQNAVTPEGSYRFVEGSLEFFPYDHTKRVEQKSLTHEGLEIFATNTAERLGLRSSEQLRRWLVAAKRDLGHVDVARSDRSFIQYTQDSSLFLAEQDCSVKGGDFRQSCNDASICVLMCDFSSLK